MESVAGFEKFSSRKELKSYSVPRSSLKVIEGNKLDL
ncbi:hypothetical protein CLV95_105117 [Leptospira borgpetersenii serovar Javanica]|nr:hypothetical protein CLV95_105117 [Leptospira borgpetersenii serovar Javanica]